MKGRASNLFSSKELVEPILPIHPKQANKISARVSFVMIFYFVTKETSTQQVEVHKVYFYPLAWRFTMER